MHHSDGSAIDDGRGCPLHFKRMGGGGGGGAMEEVLRERLNSELFAPPPPPTDSEFWLGGRGC